jgi:hypothetical protein
MILFFVLARAGTLEDYVSSSSKVRSRHVGVLGRAWMSRSPAASLVSMSVVKMRCEPAASVCGSPKMDVQSAAKRSSKQCLVRHWPWTWTDAENVGNADNMESKHVRPRTEQTWDEIARGEAVHGTRPKFRYGWTDFSISLDKLVLSCTMSAAVFSPGRYGHHVEP